MKTAIAGVLLVALAESAASQSPLFTLTAKRDYDLFGNAVTGVGDVNADGFDDFAVGAYGIIPGFVKVYSGVTGDELYKVKNKPQDSNSFGFDVDPLGDVNADGYDDWIVGSPYEEPLPRTPGWPPCSREWTVPCSTPSSGRALTTSSASPSTGPETSMPTGTQT